MSVDRDTLPAPPPGALAGPLRFRGDVVAIEFDGRPTVWGEDGWSPTNMYDVDCDVWQHVLLQERARANRLATALAGVVATDSAFAEARAALAAEDP